VLLLAWVFDEQPFLGYLAVEYVGTGAQPLDEAVQVVFQFDLEFGRLFQLISKTPGLVGCQRR